MFDETGAPVWSATHYVWGAVWVVKMYGGGAGAATAWSDGGSINGGGTNGAAPAWQGKQGASLVPARERAQAEGAARELICPFRFPGQYEDVETGLNYNRHRYYDALTGQYCSPDPIGLAGGDRPQGYVDRPGSWVDPLGLAARLHPQGITPRQFDAMSSKIRAHADSRGLGDDIFVQGSRANGSAKASSDVDIAIRVPADKFDQIMNDPIIVRKRLSNPNPTSSAMKTRNEAIKQGRIHAGEARLSKLAREIEGMIGKPVDISIIRAGGPFDNGPQIPLSFGF